tara:strand:+ start:21 stop:179 length:159 start_codon:yes stop_codon:yes gene_type:complete
MPKYGFYSTSNTSKEIIKSIDANTATKAEALFAKIKKLDLETFRSLYEVIER